MILNYDENQLTRYENFKGGEKYLDACIHFDGVNRIIYGRLPSGGSIGMHVHEDDCEIVHILKGQGKFVYDGNEERVTSGTIHYCPKGHEHTFINDSDANIIFFAVIPQQK